MSASRSTSKEAAIGRPAATARCLVEDLRQREHPSRLRRGAAAPVILANRAQLGRFDCADGAGVCSMKKSTVGGVVAFGAPGQACSTSNAARLRHGAVRRYNGIPPYEQTHAYVRAVLGRGRPAADVQEPEEQDPSADRAHAGSEADHAEGAPVALRLQDGHPAADGAAGLGPRALDEAAELDPAADTIRLVLRRGADRLTVDGEPVHNPERPVTAAMHASDPGAQRESNRRPCAVDGRRVPTPGSGQRAPVGSSPTARGADPPQPEPATCASAGLPRGRPGENFEKAVPVPDEQHGGGHARDDRP